MVATIEATAWDFTLYQGATFRRTHTWKSGEPLTPVDLTGYSARLQLRTLWGDANAALTLSNGSGITLGGVAGTIEIEITAAQSEALIASGSGDAQYLHDLRLVAPGGDVIRLLHGTVTVSPRITSAS